jgi:hypothetical protein
MAKKRRRTASINNVFSVLICLRQNWRRLDEQVRIQGTGVISLRSGVLWCTNVSLSALHHAWCSGARERAEQRMLDALFSPQISLRRPPPMFQSGVSGRLIAF